MICPLFASHGRVGDARHGVLQVGLQLEARPLPHHGGHHQDVREERQGLPDGHPSVSEPEPEPEPES